MSLKVIGAGIGRTGTMSLKLALERLLGGPCYHMTELFRHLPEHTPMWHAAARGEPVDWDSLFEGYVAAVDEPVSIYWQTLATHYSQALVILSVRDAKSWWRSANDTILKVKQQPLDTDDPQRIAWHAMIMDSYVRLYPNGVHDPDLTQQSFLNHIERVKAGVPADRLLVWQVSDGWAPLCKALDVPIPDEPFPHSNTTEEFLARRRERTEHPG